VPGSINVTMTRSAVGTRAAWVVDPESDVVVTSASDAGAVRLGRLLEAVGFRSIRGLLAGGVTAWQETGFETDETPAIDPAGLAERIRAGDVAVLDVRDDDEWAEGHVAGSIHVPYMRLGNGLPAELTNGKPIAVACSTGNRSAIAVSLLARAGVTNVVHVTDGGVAELAGEGIELVRGAG
jgi:rhodanese-related sulfurtransferase